MSAIITPSWVYNFDDFKQMYDLSKKDCQKKILDFPGVIGSFNAESALHGMNVTSAGRVYNLSDEDFTSYVESFLEKHITKLQNNPGRLQDKNQVKKVIKSWQDAANKLIADYAQGKKAGRYLGIDLNNLPFKTHEFDLVLCTHLLFHKTLPKEITSIQLLHKLCEISQEVRLYPLLDRDGKITDELGPLMLTLQQENYGVEVREVAYKEQSGGNAMLRIWAQSCVVA